MRGGGGGGALRAPGAPPWEPPRAATRVCGGPSQPAEPLLCPQDIQHTEEFLIKPESRVAQLDTSQWPLLLKVGGGTGGNQGSALPPARPPLSVLGYGAALLAATCGARGRAQPRACRDRAAELVAVSGCLISPHRLLQALVKKKLH